jgi:hypothetical protein
MKIYIATTRFNNNTWNENKNWRSINKWPGCIYNTPIKIRDCIVHKSNVFVLEMNNDLNAIMGVGYIKNFIHLKNKKKFRVYSDMNYNRYIYKSNYRIDKDEFNDFDKKIIGLFEILLFTGSRHSKRGQGISRIPQWLHADNYKNYIRFFTEMFERRGYEFK